MNKFTSWINNIYTKVKIFFSAAEVEIKKDLPIAQTELVKVFGQEAISGLELAASGLLKDGIGKLILDVVQALQATEFSSNTEKRNAAYKAVVDDLIKQGKSISESVINLAIELAVMKLKTL